MSYRTTLRIRKAKPRISLQVYPLHPGATPIDLTIGGVISLAEGMLPTVDIVGEPPNQALFFGFPESPLSGDLQDRVSALEEILQGSGSPWPGSVTPIDGALTFSRSSTAWSKTDGGLFSELPANSPRQNSRGLLIEGSYKNLINNAQFNGTNVFHTGRPARISPVVSGGVITGATIIDGGSDYSLPPSLSVTGSGGSGFSGACTLTGGVVSSVTITSGGINYPSDTGLVTRGGTFPTGWSGLISQGSYGGISIAGTTVVNGLPMLLVRFAGLDNGRSLYLQSALSATDVVAGDVISESIYMKLAGGSIANMDLIGISFTEGAPVSTARTIYRLDLLRDRPDDLHLVENPGRIMGAGVTSISGARFAVSGVSSGDVFDITLAIGGMFLGKAPIVTSPLALTSSLVLGAELLSNGDFSLGSAPPTLGGGWTISGGKASRTDNGGNSSYAVWSGLSLTPGQSYLATYDIDSISGGNLYASLMGGTTLSGRAKSVAGSTSDTFSAVAGSNAFRIGGSLSATMVVDNVSLKALSGNDGLTRSADLVGVPPLVFSQAFNSDSWAVAIDAEIERGNSKQPRALWQMDDGTDDNRVTVRTVAGLESLVVEIVVGGVVVATTSPSKAVLPGRRFRAMLSSNGNNVVDLTVDGGITKNVLSTMPLVTQAREGNNVAGTMPWNGRVAQTQILNAQPSTRQKTKWSIPSITVGEPFIGPAAPDDSFCIGTLPDVHVSTSAITINEWNKISQWLVNNKDAHRIVAVVSEGDIVVDGTTAEFNAALPGYQAIIDAGYPFVINFGNHDHTNSTFPDRNAPNFDAAFPVSMFSGKPWFGGTMAGQTKNMWSYLDVPLSNGVVRKFLLLSLDLNPDDDMLAWGLGVCNANLDREVIFVTHSYLDPDGTLTLRYDLFGANDRSFPNNDAQGTWDKLGKLAPNMKFIVSGHQYRVPAVTTSYLLSTGVAGNRVHQWFANYQNVNGGNGTIGLLRFHSSSNSVDLLAYSVLTGSPDPVSILTLDW